jgi:hypothetical protein
MLYVLSRLLPSPSLSEKTWGVGGQDSVELVASENLTQDILLDRWCLPLASDPTLLPCQACGKLCARLALRE